MYLAVAVLEVDPSDRAHGPNAPQKYALVGTVGAPDEAQNSQFGFVVTFEFLL